MVATQYGGKKTNFLRKEESLSDGDNYATEQFLKLQSEGKIDSDWTVFEQHKGGGQGSICAIRKTTDKNEQRIFKCLKSSDEEAIKRFCCEVKIVAEIDHPNIIRFLDWSDEFPYWHISKKGRVLWDYWRAMRKKLSQVEIEAKALKLITQLASGLATIHERGLVHRDIKGPNIIAYDDTPVLIDFGLVYDKNADERITRPSQGGVGNEKFSHDSQRYYSLNPRPWWDVFSLVQVFQYLATEQTPKSHWRRPLDWKYIQYPETGSAAFHDSMRVLGAQCSLESRCPKNGTELCELIDVLFGRQNAEPSKKCKTIVSSEIIDAIEKGKKHRLLEQAVDAEKMIVDVEMANYYVSAILGIFQQLSEEYPGVSFQQVSTLDQWVAQHEGLAPDDDTILAVLTCEQSGMSIDVKFRISGFPTRRWSKSGNPAPPWQSEINLFAFRFERVPSSSNSKFPKRHLNFTIDRTTKRLQMRDENWRTVTENDAEDKLSDYIFNLISDDNAWRSFL